jgi:hypothetical protein
LSVHVFSNVLGCVDFSRSFEMIQT